MVLKMSTKKAQKIQLMNVQTKKRLDIVMKERNIFSPWQVLRVCGAGNTEISVCNNLAMKGDYEVEIKESDSALLKEKHMFIQNIFWGFGRWFMGRSSFQNTQMHQEL